MGDYLDSDGRDGGAGRAVVHTRRAHYRRILRRLGYGQSDHAARPHRNVDCWNCNEKYWIREL